MNNPVFSSLKLRASLLVTFLLVAGFLISCKKEDVNPPPPVDYRGQIIRDTLLLSYSRAQVDSLLNAQGIGSFIQATHGVKVFRVYYRTPSWDNTQTYATGLVVFPDDTTLSYPLASYQHGTIVQKNQSVSFITGAESYLNIGLASTGYVCVAPDYLGMGDGPGFHPYQHAKSEATAGIDLLRAVRKMAPENGIKFSGKLFLFGYSQGGHATMAMQKEIQENHASEFSVTAMAPMSGAYDMSGAQTDMLLSDDVYPAPHYLPYLILAYNMIYKFKATNADIFKEPYLTTVVPLFNGLVSYRQIDTTMPNVPKRAMIDTLVANYAAQQNHAFRVALRNNDLINWVPAVPTKIYYASKDSHVHPQNSINCYNKMVSLGATQIELIDIGPYDHTQAAPFCMLSAKAWFDSLK